jgi:hypothetical protein
MALRTKVAAQVALYQARLRSSEVSGGREMLKSFRSHASIGVHNPINVPSMPRT